MLTAHNLQLDRDLPSVRLGCTYAREEVAGLVVASLASERRMTNREATVLMGGGIDSAACAHLLQARGHVVRGIFIDYGQAAAANERLAVETLTTRLNVPLAVHTVTGTVGYSSGELVGRNAFLVFSAIFLSRCNTGLLAIGIHGKTPYYDCSPPFFDAMSRLVAEERWHFH